MLQITEVLDIVLMTAILGFLFKDAFRPPPKGDVLDAYLSPKGHEWRHFWWACALIAPATPDEFLATWWGRRAVHLRHDGRTFDLVIDWPAVTSLLESGGLTFPATVVSRRDEPVPPIDFTREDGRTIDGAAVQRLFEDGASFSIRGADARSRA